jgi:hypothetical protein
MKVGPQLQAHPLSLPNTPYFDSGEPIKCASSQQPTTQKHTNEVVRYLLVSVAVAAVLFLVATALYYSNGSAVIVKHVRMHPPLMHLVHPVKGHMG